MTELWLQTVRVSKYLFFCHINQDRGDSTGTDQGTGAVMHCRRIELYKNPNIPSKPSVEKIGKKRSELIVHGCRHCVINYSIDE
jgi:hypothetical protein